MESAPRRPWHGPPSKLGLTFAKASLVFEGVVLDLLCGGWEELPRGLAQQMAGALRRAAGDAGWWDRESALRAVESLLSVSSCQVLPVRREMGERLLELLALLKNDSTFRSA